MNDEPLFEMRADAGERLRAATAELGSAAIELTAANERYNLAILERISAVAEYRGLA
jgi:hypothetical protein